jgi:IS5 family transposase
MSQQRSFAEVEYRNKKRQTRREVFLAEMEAVMPWTKLLAKLEPHYPKAGRRGRPPMPLAHMFRIYCLQQWFGFSDRQMEDALYEIDSVRRFAGFGSVNEALPDETTILNFRHLLEVHALPPVLLAEINAHLQDEGIAVSRGSMVDATIIPAPSSTKNAAQARDRKQSAIRARVAHVFRVIKRQFGYTKTRYRGLAKNAAQVNMLVGLANLYLLRGRLQAA